MANKNITRVLILNVPLDNEYQHTLYFQSTSKQEEYFKSRKIFEYENFSFQEVDKVIRLPETDKNGLVSNYHYLMNMGANYVMYQNSNNKWFYGFIKDIKYQNSERTDIEFEIDVMQTWMFNYDVKPSFVEREHVNNDTIGLHTIPEALETGEYVVNDYDEYVFDDPYIIVGTTYANNQNVLGGLYGGSYSGIRYLGWKLASYQKVNEFLNDLAEDEGKIEAVECIFIAPFKLIENYYNSNTHEITGHTNISLSTEFIVGKHGNLLENTYSPRNKKLLTYPYTYMLASNNAGSNAIYKYEDFKDTERPNECRFNIVGCVTPSCSIKLIPLYYKGKDKNLIESINGGKFPICNWNSDVFTNWLTQNGTNISVSNARNLIQTGVGIGTTFLSALSGNVIGATAGVGMVVSGLNGITDTMTMIEQQSMIPPQAEGDLNSGDVVNAMKENKFVFYDMSIKEEYAKCIDGYFDMFGYKVNMVKVPNRNHRKYYWYTKTIDVNINGEIPNNDLQVIKRCYNNGITFWKEPSKIKDYSVENEIV